MSVDLLARFPDAKRAGKGWSAKCPAHDDRRASLSIGTGADGRWLLKCHAGCALEAILAAAHLAKRDLLPTKTTTTTKKTIAAIYDYTDENGTLLYQVVRYQPKDFRQRRPDGKGDWLWNLGDVRRVLFGLPGLRDHKVVYIGEGEKDVLRLRTIGLIATTNAGGAGKWRQEYTAQLVAAGVESVVVPPHKDAPGRQHAEAVALSCHAAGLKVKIIGLPDLPSKGDVSDWLDAGRTRDQLIALVKAAPLYVPAVVTTPPVEPANAAPRPPQSSTAGRSCCSLPDVHEVFRRWLGDEYDLDAINVTLAAAAIEQLDGDPLWTLIVSGSGNAKTETVQALAGAGAIIASTITSDGALLSGSPTREKAKDATGGLLRKIGARGLLVIKDMTSILSMNRDTRGAVLAALREIHDGRWERNVGTDGGRTLSWRGRIIIVGAVTTAWDRAHDVIASMGDRFVLIRMDSTVGRLRAGRQAVANTGCEETMRAELSEVVAGLLAGVQLGNELVVSEAERERILAAADVVTLARTGVDYDYRGDVIDAHAPEMPTRFAKQLAQVLRGSVALGMDRRAALQLAIRCARDSLPPLRLAILDDVTAHPDSTTKDVRQRLGKPRATVDRQLQALQMLNVLVCVEEETFHAGKPATLWRYRLAEGINPDVLNPDSVPDLSPRGVTG